jgi:hypothetical protein
MFNMYYTRSYNLKTGEIKTEGVFSELQDCENLCEELCKKEDKNENSRTVFITEETEEPRFTVEEATQSVVAQMCKEHSIPEEHFEQILRLFKENL